MEHKQAMATQHHPEFKLQTYLQTQRITIDIDLQMREAQVIILEILLPQEMLQS